MATTIAGLIALSLLINEQLTAASATEGHLVTRAEESWNFTDGTGTTAQADLVFCTRQTISASGTYQIDLAGTLKTPLGESCVFAEVCAIYVRSRSGGAGGVVKVGPPASNGIANLFAALGDAIRLAKGADFLWRFPTGLGVVASTGDLLDLVEVGASLAAQVDIIIIGRSA